MFVLQYQPHAISVQETESELNWVQPEVGRVAKKLYSLKSTVTLE